MPRDNHFANARTLSLDQTLLALSAATTAILFARLLYHSSYGLDLSDEGFYLSSIANPFAYAINILPSLFGFVFHWPYQLGRRHRSASDGERHAYHGAGLDSQFPFDPAPLHSWLASCGGALGRDRQPGTTRLSPLAAHRTNARKLLKWRPAWETDRVVAETARWYRDFSEVPSSGSKITLAQMNSWRAGH